LHCTMCKHCRCLSVKLSFPQLPQKLAAFASSLDLSTAESTIPNIAGSSLEVAFVAYKALWAFLMAAGPASGLKHEQLGISQLQSLQRQATPRSALACSIGKQLQDSGVVQHVTDAAATACKLLQNASSAGPLVPLLMLSEQLMQACSLVWMFGRPSGAAESRLLQAKFTLPLAALQATSTYIEALPPGSMPRDSKESIAYKQTATMAPVTHC
jgi:hypothetical protein